MKIPKAYARAQQRLREGATPLYNFITNKLNGVGLGPLGTGVGALTEDYVKAVQQSGRRGYVDVTYYEPPGGVPRDNKFTSLGALNYTGSYPRHLLTAKGREVFYNEKIK